MCTPHLCKRVVIVVFMNVLCCCFVEQADAARRNGKAVSELKLRVQRKEMLLRMNNIVDEDDAPIPVRQKNNTQ